MSSEREIGLALSGGGYRASLFHLGALRRLNELGLLEMVGRISSVSGGSILSGFIADRMLQEGKTTPQFSDWEAAIARDFRHFVSKDIRTYLVARYFVWNAFVPKDRATALANAFWHRLTKRYLTELPSAELGTEFMFLATDFERNVAWEFERHRVGNYLMSNKARLPSKGISIARAVAASASFPPVFGPVRFPIQKKGSEDEYVAWLSDGGVYDNLGMEPVWKGTRFSRVLISDGGAILDEVVPKKYGGRLLRYSSIAMDQVRSQRQQRFIAKIKRDQKAGKDYNGALWRNASKRKSYRQNADADGKKRIDAMIEKENWYGYDDSENGTIDKYIATIRTDLNSFTEAEAKILENHGYFCADIGIRGFLPEYLPIVDNFQPPHGDELFLSDAEVRGHLRFSSSRFKNLARVKAFFFGKANDSAD